MCWYQQIQSKYFQNVHRINIVSSELFMQVGRHQACARCLSKSSTIWQCLHFFQDIVCTPHETKPLQAVPDINATDLLGVAHCEVPWVTTASGVPHCCQISIISSHEMLAADKILSDWTSTQSVSFQRDACWTDRACSNSICTELYASGKGVGQCVETHCFEPI